RYLTPRVEIIAVADVHTDGYGVRTMVVPFDIVGVARRSPPRVRKRTPWHATTDARAILARAGGREWFDGRIFVESQEGHARSGYGASLAAHICGGVALVVFLIARPDQAIFVR